ncbi:MAG: DUF262 domain-containing protein, partial [Clostridiaceae bacterium]|nr:DUF262 domain-containing protein [Clostridiaceae bacterium]
MDASPKTIFDIFNGSRNIEVPFFQRAYVWDEPQWERMLEDVEDVCLVRNPNFLGSVILKQKPTSADRNYGDVRTVIDGQQRLTTLSILLKVLCLKTGNMPAFDKRFRLDDNRTVLQHNHNDIQRYTEIMDLEDIQDITHKD